MERIMRETKVVRVTSMKTMTVLAILTMSVVSGPWVKIRKRTKKLMKRLPLL